MNHYEIQNPFTRNKSQYIQATAAWLEQSRDIWDLFAVTVTFQRVDQYSHRGRWEYEWERILYRIARKLTSNPKKQKTIIPRIEQFHYEREEASKFKKHFGEIPPHIHGIIPIPKEVSNKFWSWETNQANPAIIRDIMSMKTVLDVQIKPLLEPVSGGALGWLGYMYKGGKEL